MKPYIGIPGLSRREFLRMSGVTMLALLAANDPVAAYVKSLTAEEEVPQLGRIVAHKVHVYDTPSIEAKWIRTFWQDMVLPITSVTDGLSAPTHNKTWYELNGEGFVHSGNVQPVVIALNPVLTTIPEKGVLAEVTVPYTDAIRDLPGDRTAAYRMYYSTTHWIFEVTRDEDGEDWYRIQDDFNGTSYYVKSKHLRIIEPAEVTAISADVPQEDKRLEVHLTDQTVIAYEGNAVVKTFSCSSGAKIGTHYLTPVSKATIINKRPSRHMYYRHWVMRYSYDLPGIPWVSYFNTSGMAFHGTYWHNDFGHANSNGCINLASADAKWIYRWSTPQVTFGEQQIYATGTRVEITL